MANLPSLPAKPSKAGSPGRGGARERAQFSPSGGNGDKRTQGELARRAKRRWPGPLRRRAAMGKVGRRPQAAKSPCGKPQERRAESSRPTEGENPPTRAATWAAPTKRNLIPDRGGEVIFRRFPRNVCPRFWEPAILKCSAEVNSACAKVLPAAKRLYGASAPPHLRWGPGRNAGRHGCFVGTDSALTPKSRWRSNLPASRPAG